MKKMMLVCTIVFSIASIYAQQTHDMQTLVARYTAEIDQNKRYADKDYINRMLDREMTILATLKDQKKISHTFQPNDQTAEFMQQRGVDALAFHNAHSLLIQHLITKEIVGIAESAVAFVCQNPNNPTLTTFAQHTCDLAIAAQQLNQQGQITQAITITDCCHFFNLYGKTIVDGHYNADTLEIATKDLGKALYSYVAFAEKLYNAPKIVLAELKSDFEHLAEQLQNVVDSIEVQCSAQSSQDELQNGLVQSLSYCKQVVADNHQQAMLKASLLFLCASASRRLRQVNQVIDHNVPEHVTKTAIGFGRTPEGDIVVFVEKTQQAVTEK